MNIAASFLRVGFVAILLLAPARAQSPSPLKAKLPEFDVAVERLFKESGAPGLAVGLVHRGEVIYLKGFGIREAGRPELVDGDTVFQLASCSKPMTSTGLASLVSKKKLSWKDRVQRWLPEFRLSDDWVTAHLTIADLLSHHSGLPGGAGDALENLGLDRATILERLRLLPAAYDFRDGYAYSNYGFTTAAVAGARADGRDYEEMMDLEVFGPLGMTSSSARESDFRRRSNRASTHVLVGGQARVTARHPQPQAPAGGVSSSARDVTRWLQLHIDAGKFHGKQFIERAALGETYQIYSRTVDNPGDFSAHGYYGLGWNVAQDSRGNVRVSHSGAFCTGVRTIVTVCPADQFGVVVLCNAYPNALPEAINQGALRLLDQGQVDLDSMRKTNQVISAALQSMLAPSVNNEPPANPLPPLPLKSYTGSYFNDFFGNVQVVQRGERLVLRMGKVDFPLTHLSRDTFGYTGEPGRLEDIAVFQITFSLDGKGVPEGFLERGIEPVSSPWFKRLNAPAN